MCQAIAPGPKGALVMLPINMKTMNQIVLAPGSSTNMGMMVVANTIQT